MVSKKKETARQPQHTEASTTTSQGHALATTSGRHRADGPEGIASTPSAEPRKKSYSVKSIWDDWGEFERQDRAPFCRCCGSRDLLTMEQMIRDGSKVPADVVLDRAWNALNDLDDVGVIVAECHSFSTIETELDLVCELTIELDEGVSRMARGPIEQSATRPVQLAAIQVEDEDAAETSRKEAFLRLFESFSPSLQRRAVTHLQARLASDHSGDAQ